MKKKNTDIFGALADPNRRKILMLLSAGILSVSALAEQFEVSRPAISKHIKVLEENNLVTVTDQGRERLCELQQQGFLELYDWIKFYDAFWNEKFNNLENYLNKDL
ncbi:ArsR/SmtB family transcription factor [Mucilaginibacter polytrichastri]|uniref:HTH arsR-type domain-containing protein n=1 Tax=Mucilaginibacter polytrichastri TaxID=1302689 RepID=A0A1Q6A5Y1_9SPHI|nr:metalloregulator ArsR/SmtB family transcription factor [Mucilaginibacter polytrichastri]OKS89414.1 hypothetical protein RG47T_4898 [Mucilaginibacter polytrichastri]SFS72965.1 transcriptional regulator, ArsR family [Mucilaginibacter polytrichastri]